ncbi:MAG TPA: hypothetical protein VHX62_16525 [Solirubrobacteraceae bacterium]|nr:hypothetical protein [Solirubrobacteraceae bacterium]
MVARSRSDYWTVLTRDDTFLPIGYQAPHGPLDASQLRACCAHEIAHHTLVAIARSSRPDRAQHADQLRVSRTGFDGDRVYRF